MIVKPRFRLTLFLITLSVLVLFIALHHPVLAQETAPVAPGSAAAPESASRIAPGMAGNEPELIEVNVDWIEQLWKGGLIVLAQLLLSVVGLAIGFERLIAIRQARFAPAKLLRDVLPKGAEGDWDGVLERSREDRSLLAQIVTFIAEHRHNDLQHIQQGAGDIGVREMRHQLQRIYPLAVVGSLAPLLGLLGTMIGMIEAFALVAVYGDEGGASLLADSIAKALITTAVGLIIAIPALGLYYWLKQRTMTAMSDLETSVEAVIDEWFLKPEGESRRRAKEKKRQERQALREAMDQRLGKPKGGLPAAAKSAPPPPPAPVSPT